MSEWIFRGSQRVLFTRANVLIGRTPFDAIGSLIVEKIVAGDAAYRSC